MFQRLHVLRLGCHALADPSSAFGLADMRFPNRLGRIPTEAQRTVQRLQRDALLRSSPGLWRKLLPEREYPVPGPVARGFAAL